MGSGPMLDIEQQYKAEIAQIPVLSSEQEKDLVARARQGDQEARHELIVSCLYYIERASWPYARFRDPLDLCQIGSITVIECLDKALATENPYGYLIRAAKLSILSECRRHSNVLDKDCRRGTVEVVSLQHLLRLLDMGNRRLREKTLWIESLVQVLSSGACASNTDGQQRDWSALYAAIEKLTPQQRTIIERSFGLGERPAESASAIGRALNIPFSKDPASAVCKRKNVALKRLHTMLSTGRLRRNSKTPLRVNPPGSATNGGASSRDVPQRP